MQPNYELFDRLMISIDKYELETKEEKRALIQKAFDLCSFPKDFFDIELVEKKIKAFDDCFIRRQNRMVADIIKEAGGTIKNQSSIIEALFDKNKMTNRKALEMIEQAIIDGSVVAIQNGKRRIYTLPQAELEKENLDADDIKILTEVIKECGGKTNRVTNLVYSIMNRKNSDYDGAWRIINKAVDCGAIKVIQNGKRKTFYLPGD